MSKWNPSPRDIAILCNAITENFVSNDPYHGDYCSGCGYHYGNAEKHDGRLPHNNACPVLVAQDVMTGIPNVVSPSN